MRARRGGLTAAILLMIAAVACEGDADESTSTPLHEYVTVPDRTPPVIDVTAYHGVAGREAMADDALFFLGAEDGDATGAPLIVDSRGEPVWIGPDVRGYDLRVQQYKGGPVLTWWRRADGDKRGAVVLMDRSYRTIATVSTQGVHPDFHETTITPRGTALLIGHRTVARDLSSLGGPSEGFVKDSVVQEVDIATGRV